MRDGSSLFGSTAIGVLLMFAGGMMYGLHVYFPVCAPLGFVSTTPWVLLLLMPRCRARLWLFLGMIYLMAIIGLMWLSEFNTQSWLVAPILYIPLFIPLYVITRAVRRKWPVFPLIVLWPLAFTGVEWFRVQASPGQLPLCLLSDSVVEYSVLIQIVDILGTGSVTFVLCIPAGFGSELILARWEHRPVSRQTKGVQLAAIAAVFVAVLSYGFVRYSEDAFTHGPKVLAVQPLFEKWLSAGMAPNRLSRLERQTRASVMEPVDLIVWPENSLAESYNDRTGNWSDPVVRRIQMLAAELDAPILVDGPSQDGTGKQFHTATLVTPNGRHCSYDKTMLVPWSEYLPFQSSLAALHPQLEAAYLDFVGQFSQLPTTVTSGQQIDVRAMPLVTKDRTWYFGTPICMEIGTSGLLRNWHRTQSADGNRGVDFIINPTNEVLLGRGVHWQTMTAARFRAIEGRVSIFRAANDGVSALIDPNGRVRQRLVRYVDGRGVLGRPATLLSDIIIDSRSPTVYSQAGDGLPVCCLVVSTVMAAVALILSYFSARLTVPRSASLGSAKPVESSASTTYGAASK